MSTFNKEISSEAIILRKKKSVTSSLFPLILSNGEFRYGTIENSRLNSLKNGGYLQPFALVYITLSEDATYSFIKQVDGKVLVPNLTATIDNIAYISFIGELIFKLFQHSESNKALYSVIKKFLYLLPYKPIPLATIILGWQMMQLAGFLPSAREFIKGKSALVEEIRRSTGCEMDDELFRGLQSIIKYQWNRAETMHLKPNIWHVLEQILYAFVTEQVGEELEAIDFIKKMQCKLF